MICVASRTITQISRQLIDIFTKSLSNTISNQYKTAIILIMLLKILLHIKSKQKILLTCVNQI